MSLLWDEISQEESACYFPHVNRAGGFCREHSEDIVTTLSSFESAVSIAEALCENVIHYGKEASVIAMASFSSCVRGAFPVLVSPTCKKGDSPRDSASLVKTVLDAWKSFGASTFGPIWSFASDGDAGRRAMVYQMFMKCKVGPGHYLFKYLSRLPGLNLQTGDDDIRVDFDWKHILKRLERLWLTFEGIMINDTVINCHTIRRHLLLDESLSDTHIERMMNPEDSQDVPRAIEFLEAIESIRDHPMDNISDPSLLQKQHLIGVIGELFASFMDAFLRPDWDLKEQLTSLSKVAHATCALFVKHGINFMPNQLYGDMQTTIKNVFFCVAKQQELDVSQPLYLFNMGDDRLESLFGCVRMQGAHNPNFTYKQLLDRLAAAIDLEAIFTRHPKLHTGFR
ncbi:hypothetical protein K474DRAFT_1706510 [Panus rudis PR-1116 ss-1]|nr:hypothetical protein K474DRAFT_1706510 [Panus rudis PR-1116 ss-1]